MDLFLYILTWIAFVGGGFFLISGSIGLLRFPDFYSRMHAAGMIDTLGAGLILLGMIMQAGMTLTAVKLAFIGFFIFFTSPTATYAIANAAFSKGLRPLLADQDEEEDTPSKT